MDFKEIEENIRDRIKKEKRLERMMESIKMKILREQLEKEYREEIKIKRERYYLITISPKECEISELIALMEKIRKKKWIKIKMYTYEQRGETEEEKGKGKHIHMLIENNRSKSRVINEIHNTVNKYCEKEKVDVKNITDKETVEEYMKGNKLEDKKQKVEIDKKWREENNLQSIYY